MQNCGINMGMNRGAVANAKTNTTSVVGQWPTKCGWGAWCGAVRLHAEAPPRAAQGGGRPARAAPAGAATAGQRSSPHAGGGRISFYHRGRGTMQASATSCDASAKKRQVPARQVRAGQGRYIQNSWPLVSRTHTYTRTTAIASRRGGKESAFVRRRGERVGHQATKFWGCRARAIMAAGAPRRVGGGA